MQLLKGLDWVAAPIIMNAILIVCNAVIGINAARVKNFPRHKAAMWITCFWTFAPGGMRLGRYLSSFVMARKCEIPSVPGFWWRGGTIGLVCLLPTLVAIHGRAFFKDWLLLS